MTVGAAGWAVDLEPSTKWLVFASASPTLHAKLLRHWHSKVVAGGVAANQAVRKGAASKDFRRVTALMEDVVSVISVRCKALLLKQFAEYQYVTTARKQRQNKVQGVWLRHHAMDSTLGRRELTPREVMALYNFPKNEDSAQAASHILSSWHFPLESGLATDFRWNLLDDQLSLERLPDPVKVVPSMALAQLATTFRSQYSKMPQMSEELLSEVMRLGSEADCLERVQNATVQDAKLKALWTFASHRGKSPHMQISFTN
eukprot:Skav226525  [mRNA]  locus=scaffold1773:227175:232496:- [translate_table: standard]